MSCSCRGISAHRQAVSRLDVRNLAQAGMVRQLHLRQPGNVPVHSDHPATMRSDTNSKQGCVVEMWGRQPCRPRHEKHIEASDGAADLEQPRRHGPVGTNGESAATNYSRPRPCAQCWCRRAHRGRQDQSLWPRFGRSSWTGRSRVRGFGHAGRGGLPHDYHNDFGGDQHRVALSPAG